MNETADVANGLPAIILLSFWWAYLSMLQVLTRQGDPTQRPDAGRQADKARAAEDEPDFPELRAADPDFRAAAFLQGACRAYEEVLRAYAAGDMKALQTLLSAEVFRAFADAFEARSRAEETLELTFVGFEVAEIASAEVRADAIEISVNFRAQVIQAERSVTGEVVRGDPGAITVVADRWTFSRSRPEPATSWILVATDEPREPA